MFQDYYGDRAPDQLAKEFGPAFATGCIKLKPGSWQGPIESGYGWHLVWIESITPGRVPAFEEVEPDVKTAWLADQKAIEWQKAYEKMRAKYEVVAPQPPAEARTRSRQRDLRWRHEPHRLQHREFLLRFAILGSCVGSCSPACVGPRDAPRLPGNQRNSPNHYDVMWRTPVNAGMRLPIVLQLPERRQKCNSARLCRN